MWLLVFSDKSKIYLEEFFLNLQHSFHGLCLISKLSSPLTSLSTSSIKDSLIKQTNLTEAALIFLKKGGYDFSGNKTI